MVGNRRLGNLWLHALCHIALPDTNSHSTVTPRTSGGCVKSWVIDGLCTAIFMSSQAKRHDEGSENKQVIANLCGLPPTPGAEDSGLRNSVPSKGLLAFLRTSEARFIGRSFVAG